MKCWLLIILELIPKVENTIRNELARVQSLAEPKNTLESSANFAFSKIRPFPFTQELQSFDQHFKLRILSFTPDPISGKLEFKTVIYEWFILKKTHSSLGKLNLAKLFLNKQKVDVDGPGSALRKVIKIQTSLFRECESHSKCRWKAECIYLCTWITSPPPMKQGVFLKCHINQKVLLPDKMRKKVKTNCKKAFLFLERIFFL